MKEVRYLSSRDDIEIRAEKTEDGKRFLSGYASVFNSRSKLIYEQGRIFYEIIERQAFDRVLNDPGLDVVATFNHDFEKILARTKSKTLGLSTDDKGLFFRFEVPDTTLGNDTFTMVQRGDYSECSFSFMVNEDGQVWERDGDDNVRRITEVSRLADVTICAINGAYGETTVDAEMVARGLKNLERSQLSTFSVEVTDNGFNVSSEQIEKIAQGSYTFEIKDATGTHTGLLKNTDATTLEVDFYESVPPAGTYDIDLESLQPVKTDEQPGKEAQDLEIEKMKLSLLKLKGQ